MILTTGIIAGTLAIAAGTATPLQPINVTRVDNNTTQVFVGHDTTMHLSKTENVNLVVYTSKRVLKVAEQPNSIDIKVKQGQTVYIDAQVGYKEEFYKVCNHLIDVKEGE